MHQQIFLLINVIRKLRRDWGRCVVEWKMEAAEIGNNKRFETGFVMNLRLREDEKNCGNRGKE